jgi:hypothetical protein
MPILFQSHIESLSVMRADGTAITFRDGRFLAEREDDIAQLRCHPRYTREAGQAGSAPAAAPTRTPVVAATSTAADLAAFPFERRTYGRGNEPFVVLHLSQNLGHVREDAAAIALAFDRALPASAKAELRFVTAARGDIQAGPRASVVERELGLAGRLTLYREAHLIVRSASDAAAAFAADATAAGTPVVVLTDGDVDELARAIADAEASYPRVSAQAAKAEKQLRAARR